MIPYRILLCVTYILVTFMLILNNNLDTLLAVHLIIVCITIISFLPTLIWEYLNRSCMNQNKTIVFDYEKGICLLLKLFEK